MALERERFPRLGFGMMRLPGKDGHLDVEMTEQMVDMYMKAGMNYFDTAYIYGESEVTVGRALCSRYPRESFFLTDKLPSDELHSPEDRDRVLNEQLKKTQTDYFDIYLLHSVQDQSLGVFEKYDCFNWAREKIAEGKIRHFGFSYHGTPECLERILDRYPFVEVVQIQLNYRDWEAPAINSGKLYGILAERNIPVIVMEPVKGGALAKVDAETEAAMQALDPGMTPASFALRYAGSLPGVMTILSGMSLPGQMEDNIRTFTDFRPLNKEERAVVEEAAKRLNSAPTVQCTACRYCVAGCPAHIIIPEMIRAVNAYTIDPKGSRADDYYVFTLEKGSGRASECLKCGRCERTCPQHLPIIKTIAEAVRFEHMD